MPTATTESFSPDLQHRIESLEIALPAPGDRLEQDEEWVVVRTGKQWKKIRLHDYADVYRVPGLYEKWVYEILQCASPRKIRQLLARAMQNANADPASLVTIDLGAGNGIVAEELARIGVETLVGIDIHDEAREAAERDRPGLYSDYIACDLLNLDDASARILDRYDFSCLTCVAALGFGDIPTEVFAEAYRRVAIGGWVAFTIKTDFLDPTDDSGFSTLIRRMLKAGALELATRESYTHRIATDGQPLLYEAFIGRKRAEIDPAWLALD
ncbi:MAG: class I SAM-dependent DNA methyltransferase [Phycisphaerales bacterium]